MSISESQKDAARAWIEMLTASIIVMLSSAGMALYVPTIAVFAKAAKLDLFGLFKELHLNDGRGHESRVLSSTNMHRDCILL
jgi:hypothetical protein